MLSDKLPTPLEHQFPKASSRQYRMHNEVLPDPFDRRVIVEFDAKKKGNNKVKRKSVKVDAAVRSGTEGTNGVLDDVVDGWGGVGDLDLEAWYMWQKGDEMAR